MSGTIMGESNSAVIARRHGMVELAKPTAARVPKVVAIKVAHRPIKKLLRMASFHFALSAMVRYHSSE